MDLSVWIVGGLLVVCGASWVIVYNADILLGAIAVAFSRVRSLTPVLRCRSPTRCGTAGRASRSRCSPWSCSRWSSASPSRAASSACSRTRRVRGRLRRPGAVARTIDDPDAALAAARGIDRGDVRAVAAQSFLSVEARQLARGTTFESYRVRGVDRTFSTARPG